MQGCWQCPRRRCQRHRRTKHSIFHNKSLAKRNKPATDVNLYFWMKNYWFDTHLSAYQLPWERDIKLSQGNTTVTQANRNHSHIYFQCFFLFLYHWWTVKLEILKVYTRKENARVCNKCVVHVHCTYKANGTFCTLLKHVVFLFTCKLQRKSQLTHFFF